MLSVSAMSGGQGAYYTGLAREDYYLEGGEPLGQWFGDGARMLDIEGFVDKELFAALFAGRDAKGCDLVQNAGERVRQPGWDLTFSAPKSVSVAWSQAPAPIGMEIRAAHDAAVRAALQYLQDNAATTRRGKGGLIKERAGLVIGLFEHGTSRAQDPQLHTHGIVLNVATRADGTTGSLESKGFYEHKMAAGALYRAELAAQLEQRLGIECERVKTWFEVKGVSRKLIDEFSTRREQIEEALAKSGYSSARASEFATVSTREVKEHTAREELLVRWAEVGKSFGWSAEQLELICGQKIKHDPLEVAKAVVIRGAIEEITEQNAYFHEKDLVRRIAEHAQDKGIGAKNVRDAAREYLEEHAITLSPKDGRMLYTTPEMLELEKDLLSRVEASKGDKSHRVPGKKVEDVLEKHPKTLNPEQRGALKHITEHDGSISVVSGLAGTGKTTMLEAARKVWEERGLKPIGAALSGKAADGLSEGAGLNSCTIAKLIRDIENGKLVLDEKTVLILDEAGMVGTRHMAAIVEAIEKAKAKLVLVGDAKQLQPIDAGGPFAAIGKRLGEAKMEKIERQAEGWHREAVKDFAEGRSAKALLAFFDKGLVDVATDKKEARQCLLDAWKGQGVKEPEKNLILTATKQDAVILNREIQAMRDVSGALGKESAKTATGSLYQGDRVVFGKNSLGVGVKNGQLGTVEAIAGGDGVTVRLDSGKKVSFSLSEYDSVTLGYAVTTHKAQGMTAERTFVLTDESMQDKELSYVQASRSRGETRIFTTEMEAGESFGTLSRRMAKSNQKMIASDFYKPKVEPEIEPVKPVQYAYT